jgi:hypothetical protein
MLGKLFGKKKATPDVIVATLNARIQPMHRHERYEDPLDAALKKYNVGEISGGGTMQGAGGEIELCDVEIQVTNTSTETIALISQTLERLGAPKGSRLSVSGVEQPVPFGVNEGLAIYLNGTDLPDEIYAKCDSNVVYNALEDALGEAGGIHSWWQGPRETAFYLYGPSFDTMKKLILPFVDSYPLCQQARIEKIA